MSVQTIELDCRPGYPRPDDLLESIPVDLVLSHDLKARSVVSGLCTMIMGSDSNCDFEHLIKKFIEAHCDSASCFTQLVWRSRSITSQRARISTTMA